MLDAILVGVYICAYIGAAAGLLNCDAYQHWKAEHEPEERMAYAVGDASDITTSADAELPEMIIITDDGE